MLKKYHLFLAATLLTTSQATQASLYFSGLYGSLGLGAMLTKGKHKFSDPSGSSSQLDFSHLGGASTINLGYVTEKGTSTVMYGGEVYLSKYFSNMRKPITLQDGTKAGIVHIHHNLAFGLAAIVGKLLNPKIMVYGKVALEMGQLAYKYQELTFGTSTSWDRNQSYKKIIPGAGFRYAYSDRFHVGFEYSLALLGNKVIRNENETIYGANRRIEVKVLDNRFMLTFTYQITAPKGN